MLTIKSPVRLSVRPSMVSLDDAFGKRLEANYHVMASSLTPENMLHFISQKQDILMEGDSMTSIVSVDNRINRQQINVELINNVLNRILVADEQKLSYQDRVFIDNVLNRIGITDVKQFMNQVSYLQHNTTSINRLLTLYSDDSVAINELKQYFKQNNIDNSHADSSTTQENHNEMWIHQQILNRLHAGDIYNELAAFYKEAINADHRIDNREFYVSEQLLQSKNIELNSVRNSITNRNTPLEYRVMNSYELGVNDEYNTDEGDIRNEYIEAVVLNAVNNAYTLRHDEINSSRHVWYSLIESIRNTAENTMNRFEYMHEHSHINSETFEQYSELMQTRLGNEITSLESLHKNYVNTYSSSNISDNSRYSDTALLYESNIQNIDRTEQLSVQEQISDIRNNIVREINSLRKFYSTHVLNSNNVQSDINNENNLDITILKNETGYNVEQNNQIDMHETVNAATSNITKKGDVSDNVYNEYEQNKNDISIKNINNRTDNVVQQSEQINLEKEISNNSVVNRIENVQSSIANELSELSELNRQYTAVWNNISEHFDFNEADNIIHYKTDETNQYSDSDNSEINIDAQSNISTVMKEIRQLHNSFSDNLSSISQKFEDNIKNVTLTHADNAEVINSTVNNMTEEYHRNVAQLIRNELNRLTQISSADLLEYKSEITDNNTQIKNISEENKQYAQQINYLTNEEEQLKNQLNSVEQTSINNTARINQITDNRKNQSTIQINRARAMADARKMLEAPEAVKLEYMNIQNEIENKNQQMNVTEKKIDENVLKIFEQIAQYQENPSAAHPNISTSSAALDSLMRDTARPAALSEKTIENNTIEKTEKLIHDVRQQEIRDQLDRIINVEVPEISYIRQPQNVELLHKVAESGINEDVLEELRSVNRNVNRSSEIHTDEVTQSDNITRTITNHVNNVELQQNEELTRIIANNVQSQLNSLTDKVYRKLEKRMDSEKRRRGL